MQRGVIGPGQGPLPEFRALVKEAEWEEVVDAWFERNEIRRCRAGQDGNPGGGKQLAQAADRFHRGDKITDMIEFDDQDAFDVGDAELWRAGNDALHRF